MDTPRVVIVEDHRLLAEVLRTNLGLRDIVATIAEPGPIEELIGSLITLAPRVVLLDLDLGEFGDSGPMVAPLAQAGIRVVVVSGTTELARIARALDDGAFGFCPKTAGFEALTTKVIAVLAASAPVDGALRRQLAVEIAVELARRNAERGDTWARFDRLTDREKSTLQALSQGLSVRDIARAWVVSEATVRTHVRAVLAKLEVPSQLAAVAAALNTGWLAEAS